MKKLIVGALVGGLVLFIWQFASYAMLDLHYSQMAYTPAQGEIMEVLEKNLTDGEYYLIRGTKGNQEQQMQLMEERMGKPWAMIQYHSSLEQNMGMNLMRAFVVDFLVAFILCWLLLNFANLSMKSSLLASIGVGLIGYLVINYLDVIWFDTSSMPDLLDAVVPWAIVGGWLGWWLPR